MNPYNTNDIKYLAFLFELNLFLAELNIYQK